MISLYELELLKDLINDGGGQLTISLHREISYVKAILASEFHDGRYTVYIPPCKKNDHSASIIIKYIRNVTKVSELTAKTWFHSGYVLFKVNKAITSPHFAQAWANDDGIVVVVGKHSIYDPRTYSSLDNEANTPTKKEDPTPVPFVDNLSDPLVDIAFYVTFDKEGHVSLFKKPPNTVPKGFVLQKLKLKVPKSAFSPAPNVIELILPSPHSVPTNIQGMIEKSVEELTGQKIKLSTK